MNTCAHTPDTPQDATFRTLGLALVLAAASMTGGWLASLGLWEPALSLHHRLLLGILVRPFALALWLFSALGALALSFQSLVSSCKCRRWGDAVLAVVMLTLVLVPAGGWF